MNILDLVVIAVPCAPCGGTYEVTATDVLRSQDLLAEECAVGNDDRECLPLHLADLLDAAALVDLQRAWARVEALGSQRGLTPRIRPAAAGG